MARGSTTCWRVEAQPAGAWKHNLLARETQLAPEPVNRTAQGYAEALTPSGASSLRKILGRKRA